MESSATSVRRFSASRLSVARRFRRLTKRALAQQVGVSAQTIGNYEVGANIPNHWTVERLVFALGFPPHFFVGDEVDSIRPEAVSFRSSRSMTASTRERMMACGEIASEVISPVFQRLFELPTFDVLDLSGEDPEMAAAILREHWRLGVGPIDNVIHLLEAKGVEVFWINEASKCLDAVSFWRDDRAYVVMNKGKGAGDRSRFDAAHELAHLTLHRNADRLDARQVEAEAHRFASAFLMPASQFRAECPRHPSMSAFFPLKRRWKVSIQAMVRRGRDLGVFNDWQYENACKEISWRGWRAEEPPEVAVESEESKLHQMIFEQLRDRGTSIEEFAADVKLRPSDLLELAPQARLIQAQPSGKFGQLLRVA